MRTLRMTSLGAMLLLGCGGDDQGGSTLSRMDASIDASVRDAGDLDGGGMDAGSLDATIDAGVAIAEATLDPKSNSMVHGTAEFSRVNGLVTLELVITSGPPGAHGAHIHVNGDCSAADASSAGDHWNPDAHPHGSGAPDAGATSHLGDLGNILIGPDGKGTLTISKAEWKLGDGSVDDVVGHSIVIHANQDDLVTQAKPDAGITPGNSGVRVACGVIMRAK